MMVASMTVSLCNIRPRCKRRRPPPGNANQLENHIAPSHPQRDFQADDPNQKWTADFPCIWTVEGWLYAAVAMDLYFAPHRVGWSMSDTMQAKMVSDALLMALWRRDKPGALMHHSDQGSQYCCSQEASVRGLVMLKTYAILIRMQLHLLPTSFQWSVPRTAHTFPHAVECL